MDSLRFLLDLSSVRNLNSVFLNGEPPFLLEIVPLQLYLHQLLHHLRLKTEHLSWSIVIHVGKTSNSIIFSEGIRLTQKVLGKGEGKKHNFRFLFKCSCSHNNKPSFIKQISLFDTA